MDFKKYLLISAASLIIFYLAFLLIFKNRTRFRQQRIFLMASLVISLLLPLNPFLITFPSINSISDYIFAGNQTQPDEIMGIELIRDTIQLSDLMFTIWKIITSAILLTFISQLFRIIWFYRNSRKVSDRNITILYSKKVKSPFSFFHLVFMPESLENTKDAESIIHESIHSTQLHSADNLIAELILALMWFNPAVWLLKRSLHLVHEYLADEGTINSGIEMRRYQSLLLNQVAEGSLMNIPSGFNNNIIKKRMIMMTKNRNKESNRVGLLSLFMLTTTLFLAISMVNGLSAQEVRDKNETRNNKEEQKEPSKEITVVGYGTQPANLDEIRVIGYGERKSQDTLIVKEGITIRSTNSTAADSTLIYIVDGVRVNSFESISPDSIESVNVLKADNLIVVRTKGFSRSAGKISISQTGGQSIPEKTIFLVNNIEVSKTALESIDPAQIQSMSVVKDREQIKTLTGKDGDGLIMITLKQN
jgi:beta-lactamase regulating signal transducer with metallopeptidase domain